jgi:hypothetical protein
MKKLLFAGLLILLFPLYASAGTIYRTNVNGVKLYTNKKIDNYDKSWTEIQFNAEEHKARLARDAKLREQMQKEDELELQRLKLILEARRVRALEMAAMRPAYQPPNYSCNVTTNYHAYRPLYYKKRFLRRRPVYTYPNISTRQAHRRAGGPIIWR